MKKRHNHGLERLRDDTEGIEGYKKTEVGVIPDDWDFKRIGEIAVVSSGGTPNRSNLSYWNGNIPWITTSQIDFNTIIYSNEFITKLGLQNSAAKLYAQNTLLMAMYGQGKTRGKVAILGIEATINQACAAITLNKDASNNYIFFYLAHNYEEIRKLSNTGNQENLNGNIIKSIFVPIPPLPEQKAIAQSLSDVDTLIAECDRIIVKKRNIKQGTMQQLLTGKKRLPGFSGEWEVRKLGEIVNKVVGGGTPSRNKKEYWNGNIFWATVKDFTSFCPYETEETITQEGLNSSASNLIPKGNLIIATRMAVGKVVIYDVDVAINQDLKAVFTKPDIDTEFLFYCFTSYSSNIDFLASGSTVKGIILEDLKNIEFPYVSLTEQKAIAQILSDMDAEIEALEQKRDKYKAIKQGMMQELLTGKTRLTSDA